jgi:hypothetical protein
MLLQKILNKVISRKIMDKFNKFLSQHRITNRRISQCIGAPDNAFNKTINEMTIPSIVTIIRYVYATEQILGIDKMDIYSKILIDDEIDRAVGILNQISDSDINDLIYENKDFFKSLDFYFSINQFKKDNPFTVEEINLYRRIKEMFNSD